MYLCNDNNSKCMTLQLDKIAFVVFILLGEYILVLFAIAADLWSGLRKAKERGEARTSYGLRRTVDKLSRYYNFMFAFTVMDLMQMLAAWYLTTCYDFTIPLFPAITLVGSLSLGAIELKSIYEKSDDKTRKDANDVLILAKEIAASRNDPEIIAKTIAEYLNPNRYDNNNQDTGAGNNATSQGQGG